MRQWKVAAVVGMLAATIGAERVETQHEHHGATMPVVVEADRVMIGAEWLPRFALTLPNVLVVPAGETVTLPAIASYDAIEVAGTLKCSRATGFSLAVIHLTVLPGGTFDCGTTADPVSGEIVIRDVPIDTAVDPWQWGNGIPNFGAKKMAGVKQPARTFVHLAQDATAGATTIVLTEIPLGWAVGDAVVLPDARQQTGSGSGQSEPPNPITAIAGNTITLAAPLGFTRQAIRDPDGGLVARVPVLNVSRSLVVRWEHPGGVQGHIADVGLDASWDVQYVTFLGLGRTKAEDLDSTRLDASGSVAHVGTNQIGRYTDHKHHAGTSHATRRSVGNVYLGAGGKWAQAVHVTHDTIVEDNIAIGFHGGCFVTEDGYEMRNVYRRNVCVGVTGNSLSAQRNLESGRNCPGCEGSGFWFRGVHQVIEENESWNNPIGINLFNLFPVGNPLVPSEPGGPADLAIVQEDMRPVVMRGNVVASNSTGYEPWRLRDFQHETLTAANNRNQVQPKGILTEQVLYLTDARLVAQGGANGTTCVAISSYVTHLRVEDSVIRGCRVGVTEPGNSMDLRRVVLQNVTNIRLASLPKETRFEDVEHRQLGAHPKTYIVFGRGDIWQPGEPFPTRPDPPNLSWPRQGGPQHVVINWQGTGQDYHLFERQSLRSAPAWPADPRIGGWRPMFVPAAGITMGESWDTYGLAFGGAVVADAEAVELEGLIGGVGRAWAPVTLGPPQAVLTYPNVITPAVAGSKSIRLTFMLTGDPSVADESVVSVNGGPLLAPRTGSMGLNSVERFVDSPDVSLGWHTVRTWRTLSGVTIPASERTYQYFVGDSPPDDDPPPNDPEPDPDPDDPDPGDPDPGDAVLAFVGATSVGQNSGNTAIEIAPHADAQAGDLAVVLVAYRSAVIGTIAAPAGWTQIGSQLSDGVELTDAAFAKVLDAGDLSTPHVFAFGTTAKGAAVMHVSRPAVPGAVSIAGHVGQVNAPSADVPFPGLTLAASDMVVLAMGSRIRSDDVTAPSGFTLDAGSTAASAGSTTNSRVRVAIAHRATGEANPPGGAFGASATQPSLGRQIAVVVQ